jgi:hypothetical protein
VIQRNPDATRILADQGVVLLTLFHESDLMDASARST